MEFVPIAHVRSDFKEKFGIPRQSGLVPETLSRIVFDEGFRREEALRGIEGFSHLWIIWVFSANRQVPWSPTVRPPRLGGNRRIGVFATRSPYRPNPIGLSCVKLDRVEQTKEGPVLVVRGADLMDGTPVLDIKPYLPYADRIDGATGGFTDENEKRKLTVVFPQPLKEKIDPDKIKALYGILEQDPRPSYQQNDGRVYGVSFSGWNVRFRVSSLELTVVEVEKI
ncbi:MAG: tRNA (N6-threonylcarbamoyladenosine(37)-N6)-methyltransferase TrmO [Clostridia bacterium]|nr:tRNA (N6-threonylcarbamoyladenosine(37)-N6)-methyltransferase TrmO [Clostridia bacterium]